MKKRLTNKYVLIIAGVLVLAVGIIGLLWATNVFGWRAFRLVDAENFIGEQLPSSAANTQFATQNQVARIVWVRFDLASETDLKTYLESLNLEAELRSGYTPFPAPNPQETNYSWWQPGEATIYSGLYAIQYDRVIEILADQTAAPQLTVYIRAYSIKGN